MILVFSNLNAFFGAQFRPFAHRHFFIAPDLHLPERGRVPGGISRCPEALSGILPDLVARPKLHFLHMYANASIFRVNPLPHAVEEAGKAFIPLGPSVAARNDMEFVPKMPFLKQRGEFAICSQEALLLTA